MATEVIIPATLDNAGRVKIPKYILDILEIDGAVKVTVMITEEGNLLVNLPKGGEDNE